MKRGEVRSFLKEGVDSLAPVLQFNAGRLSEFNSEFNKEYPYCWNYNLQPSTDLRNSLPLDAWAVTIRIAKLDKPDSLPEQYELIVDACDYIAQQLIKKYNDVLADSKLVTISGISRVPFYKQHSDCLTGVDLTFTLNVPDKTLLCV